MTTYIHLLRGYMEQHPLELGRTDIKTIAELLYHCYVELNPIDTPEIRRRFSEIDDILRALSIRDNDRVFAVVCDLCAQHEKLAFLSGLRVGAQLLLELRE